MNPSDISGHKSRATWALLCGAVLVLGATMGAWVYRDYQRIGHDAAASLKFRSMTAASDLERNLGSINTALNNLRESASFFATGKNGLEIANRQMKALSESLEGVRAFALCDAGGTIIASNRPDIVNQNIADRAHFQLARKEKTPSRLYVNAPFKTITGVYSVLLAKSIVRADGEFAGIVTAVLEPANFTRILEGVRETPDAIAGIVHGNGQVFLFAPTSIAPPTSNIALMGTLYADHRISGLLSSVTTGFSPRMQNVRMVAMTTVHPKALAMDNDLTVLVSRDVRQIFIQWRNQSLLLAGLFLGITLLSALSLRRYEQKMQSASRLIQNFLDHLPGMAYIKDQDCRVLMANRGFELIGLDPQSMIGKNNLELLPAPWGAKVTADDQRVLTGGTVFLISEEMAGRSFETSKFVIDDESGRRLLGGITLDVTARQRSIRLTQSLLEINGLGSQLTENEFLTKGLELAEQLTNSRIGFLHFVNVDQETLELVTWTSNALKGCTAVYDAHYPISQAGIWADCFRQGQTVVFNDYAACAHKQGLPQGHAPLNRLVSVPVIEAGAVRMMIGVGNKQMDYEDLDVQAVQLIGNDLWRITQRKRTEKQLQQRLTELVALNAKLAQTQVQLMQSEKLAAIGQLAAGVAHEINNPVGFVYSNLATLSGYVDDLLAIDRAYSEMEVRLDSVEPKLVERVRALKLACDHPFVVTDLRQLLRESREGLERVKTIVQDLKDFSRTGDTGWEWADLHKGLESTLNIVRNEIKNKAQIVRLFTPLPPVRCILAQINQVFMNLLVNAAQAIAEQGEITLRSGIDGEFAWIDVQDDGCGIESDKLTRIFDPFYTSKPVGIGTGLGLTLAWGIVQRHQGTIVVVSTPGKGTCMTVRLPIAGPAEVQAQQGLETT